MRQLSEMETSALDKIDCDVLGRILMDAIVSVVPVCLYHEGYEIVDKKLVKKDTSKDNSQEASASMKAPCLLGLSTRNLLDLFLMVVSEDARKHIIENGDLMVRERRFLEPREAQILRKELNNVGRNITTNSTIKSKK